MIGCQKKGARFRGLAGPLYSGGGRGGAGKGVENVRVQGISTENKSHSKYSRENWKKRRPREINLMNKDS